MFLVFVCGALALALPALARASTPPAVSGLTSPSHPDSGTWYSNANPTFSWNSSAALPAAFDGFACALDQYPTSVPSTILTAPDFFGAQQTFAVGGGPVAVAVADLGNGHPDLVAVNHLDNTVSVLLGNGDGTFAAQQTYDVGGGPEGLAIADLGNGHPDLVVANYNDGTVSVLLGNGTGTSFATQTTYAVGSGPEGVAVADLGNGHPDIVVVNHNSNNVSVLLGNGTGTSFATQTTYAVGSGPYRVAIANFNGYPDLAVTNFSDNTISVLLGNGTGTSFATQTTYAVGSGPVGIAAADLNGDGKADLAVTNLQGGTVSVLLGNGDGTFAAQQTYPVRGGSEPWGIAVADLGNGHPDLAVTDHNDAVGNGALSVLYGDGTGAFATQQDYTVGGAPVGVTAADLNDDGELDLAVTNYNDGTVGVLPFQTGATSFTASFAGKADGIWYFHVCAVDDLGVAGPTSTYEVKIDTTPPVTTSSGLSLTADAGWTNTAATVTLTPSDALSGVSATYYTIDSGSRQTYASHFSVSDPGSHKVTYWSTDNAGNVESSHIGYVNIDTTAPVTTASGLSATAGPAWSRNATVSLSANDALSGVAATYYAIDSGSRQTYSGSFKLADGAHTVIYWSVDKAGNVEATHTGYADIDTVGPTTFTKAASGHAGKAIALKYLIRDNLSHQAKDVVLVIRNSHRTVVKRFSLGTKNVSTWYQVKWTPKAKGTYTYTVTASDLAGNSQSRAGSAKITIS
jgi:hypothetical protein